MISPAEFIRILNSQIERVVPRPETLVRYLYGSVTTTVPLCVQFDGHAGPNTLPLPKLGSYTATIADRVLVVKTGSSYLVLGKVT